MRDAAGVTKAFGVVRSVYGIACKYALFINFLQGWNKQSARFFFAQLLAIRVAS